MIWVNDLIIPRTGQNVSLFLKKSRLLRSACSISLDGNLLNYNNFVIMRQGWFLSFQAFWGRTIQKTLCL